VAGPTFEPGDPPADPPDGVAVPLMWRLAHRLHADHRRAGDGPAGDGSAGDGSDRGCRTCAEPWPCGGRRLAERGLAAAREPRRRPDRP